MNNVVKPWLFLIGTPERAKSLRKKLDYIAPKADGSPMTCPTELLFGAATSASIYAHPKFRPALDAWDTGELGVDDVRRFCVGVERGWYRGAAFTPPSRIGK